MEVQESNYLKKHITLKRYTPTLNLKDTSIMTKHWKTLHYLMKTSKNNNFQNNNFQTNFRTWILKKVIIQTSTTSKEERKTTHRNNNITAMIPNLHRWLPTTYKLHWKTCYTVTLQTYYLATLHIVTRKTATSEIGSQNVKFYKLYSYVKQTRLCYLYTFLRVTIQNACTAPCPPNCKCSASSSINSQSNSH